MSLQVFDEYEEQSDIADKFRIKVHFAKVSLPSSNLI